MESLLPQRNRLLHKCEFLDGDGSFLGQVGRSEGPEGNQDGRWTGVDKRAWGCISRRTLQGPEVPKIPTDPPGPSDCRTTFWDGNSPTSVILAFTLFTGAPPPFNSP